MLELQQESESGLFDSRISVLRMVRDMERSPEDDGGPAAASRTVSAGHSADSSQWHSQLPVLEVL